MKRLSVWIGIQAICLLFSTHLWAGYRVTKVIEVGPAVPLLTGGALKWSPDGTMLAYFANNYLMVSDTLGNSRQVAAIQEPMYPTRAEWVSNGEFAVSLNDRQNTDSALYQLLVYDVATGAERLVDQFWRTAWTGMPGTTSYGGPFVTCEGNAYYVRMVVTGLEEGDPDEIRRSRVFTQTRLPLSSRPTAAAALTESHLQVWSENGLYLVDWQGLESTQVRQKSLPPAFRMWTSVSRDRDYVFNGGKLLKTSTGDTINVSDFAGPRPDSTDYCDFGSPSFNPRGDELLFEHSCERGESYVVDRIGVFNIVSRQFALLDSLTGISGGRSPIYAPDGRMIAFLAKCKAYVVYRKVVP